MKRESATRKRLCDKMSRRSQAGSVRFVAVSFRPESSRRPRKTMQR